MQEWESTCFMSFCCHHRCREILKCAKRQCFSERHYISMYSCTYSFVLKPPTEAFQNRDLFPLMFWCCLQTAVELHFVTDKLQKIWRFKACMGLSEFLRSANLMVSAYSLVLQALPGEIPDGNRDIVWLQRAHAKICIEAPDRFKRGLETQCMLAKPEARLAQNFFILHEDPTVEKHRNSISTHQKRGIFWFFMILIHSKIQQFEQIVFEVLLFLQKWQWNQQESHKTECTLPPSWVTSLLVFPYVTSCILLKIALLSVCLFVSRSSILQLFSHMCIPVTS